MADLVLNLPFDESEGSSIAYDYSPSALHAQLRDAIFTTGRNGNSILFEGAGYAEISQPVINYASTFTVMFWAKALQYGAAPTTTWFLIKFAGSERFMRLDLNAKLDTWTHVTLTHSGGVFKSYINSGLTDTESTPIGWGNATGFCSLNDNSFDNTGHYYLDDFRVYNDVAMSSSQIREIMEGLVTTSFKINRTAFSSYGVTVQRAKGLVDALERKEPLQEAWDNYHGDQVDLSSPTFEGRDIELECWIRASNKDSLVNQFNNFISQFDKSGLQQLLVDIGTRSLVYAVFRKERIAIDNRWKEIGEVFGSFTIKLREPDPVKRVLRQVVTSSANHQVSITLSCSKLLTIHWGDSQSETNIHGTNQTLTHTFSQNGEYYIVISGNIEEITGFTTNAIVVWNKL